jgi:pyrimidine operon attenuation protein / uracil phosphoribosyltransferase
MAEPATQLLTAEQVEHYLQTIAQAILDRHASQKLALIGIRKGGVPMSQRVAQVLLSQHVDVALGTVDITFHRDDLYNLKALLDLDRTEINISDLDERCVILFDDVLFTGRTIRAAIDEVLDFGRPKKIELAILIDRGCRELPIQPDYCGRVLDSQEAGPTAYVDVRLKELDGEDGVWIGEKMTK